MAGAPGNLSKTRIPPLVPVFEYYLISTIFLVIRYSPACRR